MANVTHCMEHRMSGKKSRQKTVRIPRKMVEAVERFLDTEEAEEMGFDSKADVVTAAVRELLIKYEYYRNPGSRGKKNRTLRRRA